jgi:hypothetical protein
MQSSTELWTNKFFWVFFFWVIWPSTSWLSLMLKKWVSGQSCLLFFNTGTTKSPVILELNKASIIYCSRTQDCFSSCLHMNILNFLQPLPQPHTNREFFWSLIFKRSLNYHKASSRISADPSSLSPASPHQVSDCYTTVNWLFHLLGIATLSNSKKSYTRVSKSAPV